ncbi:hypothetical protein M0812_03554 [Anaeramoeba flamelloides]|uniref:4-nitrophenylphosphatase n=1 Tax=Anaeramoeba flamelloides TaxID=1746091 RepID=A0AAV8AG07_9EUKA|nr:hypothetical protein M0812_03554 [Anaeramoeba flamelloides]
MVSILTGATFQHWITKHDSFIFDCDGVLWNSGKRLPGIKKLLNLLNKEKKQTFYLTNNSTKHFKQFRSEFEKYEFPFLDKQQLLTPTTLLSPLIDTIPNFDRTKDKIFAVGEKPFFNTMKEFGLNVVTAEDHGDPIDLFFGKKVKLDEKVKIAIIGWDRHFSWSKSALLSLYLYNRPDVTFLATNPDASFPFGKLQFPGTGSLVRMVEHATGRKAKIIGKPEVTSFEVIQRVLKKKGLVVDKKRVCMIGDRIDTDLKFAENVGISSCCVGTGISNIEDLEKTDIKIDYWVDNFGDFF